MLEFDVSRLSIKIVYLECMKAEQEGGAARRGGRPSNLLARKNGKVGSSTGVSMFHVQRFCKTFYRVLCTLYLSVYIQQTE